MSSKGPKTWVRQQERRLSTQEKLMRSAIGRKCWNRWLERLTEHWRIVLRSGATTEDECSILADLGTQKRRGEFDSNEWRTVDLAKHTLLKELSAVTGKIQKACGPFTDVTFDEAELRFRPNSVCVVDYDHDELEIAISGAVRITGVATLRHAGGTTSRVTVFQRFIGKTFWQYCYKESDALVSLGL